MTLPTVGWLRKELTTDQGSAAEAELRICFDSRKLKPGDTFWALKGSRDGHDFVASSLQTGAVAAVVDRRFTLGNSVLESKLIRVNDTFAALSIAAKAWRKRLSCVVIGLTGSVGKTTTKDYIRAALCESSCVFATEGNFNNEIGVPITILSTPIEAEALVCEMGAARVGDISHLCAISDPNVGLVTAIAQAHIETFGSIAGVQRGKGELYKHIAATGVAIVPMNDERCVEESQTCRTRIGYGFDKLPADWESEYVQGEGLSFDEEACARFTVRGVQVHLSIPGRPAAQAALAAMTVALHQGVSPEIAARGISRAVPTQGRATVRKVGSLTLIDDSYNASPASMRSALETLSLRQGARKIAILGDMLELGDISDIAHRDIVGELDHAGVALAVLIGPNFSHVASAAFTRAQLRTYPTVEQALPTLQQLVHANDLVLVKASHGMTLDRVVRKIEEIFS